MPSDPALAASPGPDYPTRAREARRWLPALAVACLVASAVACSGGPAHVAGPPGHGHSAAAAALRVPAPVPMRGTLTLRLATTAYQAAIVPAYPVALRLADALTYHPATAAGQLTAFTSSLSKALGSLAAVTAFPGGANGAFAAYRSQAHALLASFAHPAAVTFSESSRKNAALALYALARQIGQLGADLNLVPATESGGKH